MDGKHKRYSSLSKKHFRRLIANNTAFDLINTLGSTSNLINSDSSNDSINNSIDTTEMKSSDELVQCNESLEESIDQIHKSSSSSIESLHALMDSDIDLHFDLHSHDELLESDSEESTDSYDENIEYNSEIIEVNEIAENHGENQFLRDISSWAIKFNIFHTALSALLFILRKYMHYPIPKDPRTLLKTPRHTAILEMGTGEYYHFGLENALKNMLDEYANKVRYQPNSLNILINIDGLPIFKSSKSSLWLILCSDTILKSVFIVGAYFGQTKPENHNDFLRKLVNEAILLINNGLVHNEIRVAINLHGLICDAPAKAFVLAVKNHTGYNSCTQCTIRGDYINGNVCFPATNLNNALRTDQDFESNKYDDYQTGDTILKQIPNFGLVSSVPLDYMHLVCLGVVKKLILLWIKGPRSVRLSQQLLNQISGALLNLQTSVPNDFVRRPRSLKDVKFWKATEFRQFLLYTGPVVLKNVVSKDIYVNFITLHIAITILANPVLSKDNNNVIWAQKLLEYFLKCFKKIYGAEYMSHNLHNLLHICSNVQKYGPVDEFSAFRFENYMLQIKKLIRKNEKPLQQLSRRYAEIKNVNLPIKKFQNNHQMYFEKSHKNGPLITGYNFHSQYKVLHNSSYSIHANSRSNNCIRFENGTIVSVLNLVQCEDNRKYIIGKKLKIVKNLYSGSIYPCASEVLGIQIMSENTPINIWPCEKIQSKMWKIPYNLEQKQVVVFPIIHT